MIESNPADQNILKGSKDNSKDSKNNDPINIENPPSPIRDASNSHTVTHNSLDKENLQDTSNLLLTDPEVLNPDKPKPRTSVQLHQKYEDNVEANMTEIYELDGQIKGQ